jgi:CheY-like chemotaxis protein
VNGPIISIDDDSDDQFLIQIMLEELNLPNEIRLFQNGHQALDYLLTTSEKPFLILCDINMPFMNGLEVRDRIDADPFLKSKAIPFIFLTTANNRELVIQAYQGAIQGFYQKQSSFQAGKNLLDTMIKYWKSCLHPNNC